MWWKLGVRLGLAAGLAAATPALACNPPPGLSIQQFYAMCSGDLQQAYSSGMGQGAPFEMFVQYAYSQYAAGPQMPPVQQAPMAGLQQCQLGEAMCFSGWFRSCQRVGNGTMWITGAQRC